MIAPLLSVKRYSRGTSRRFGSSSGLKGSSHSSLIIVTYTGFQQATMSYLGLGQAALIFGNTVPAPPECSSQVMSTFLSAALILRVASMSGPPQSMPVSGTGACAAFERSDVAGPTERGRIVAGRRLDRRHRAHADELDHELELPRVPVAVRGHRKARFRSGEHGDSGLVRKPMDARERIELALLDFDIVRIDSDVLAPFDGVGGKGKGRTDGCSGIAHERDVLAAHVRRMDHPIDARAHRGDDGVGVTRMDRRLAPQAVRGGNDRLHFLVGQTRTRVIEPLLRLAVAADLDEVDAVLDLLPHLANHFLARVAQNTFRGNGHAEPGREIIGESPIGCDVPARRKDARTRKHATGDVLARGDGDEPGRSGVADTRDSSAQHLAA